MCYFEYSDLSFWPSLLRVFGVDLVLHDFWEGILGFSGFDGIGKYAYKLFVNFCNKFDRRPKELSNNTKKLNYNIHRNILSLVVYFYIKALVLQRRENPNFPRLRCLQGLKRGFETFFDKIVALAPHTSPKYNHDVYIYIY